MHDRSRMPELQPDLEWQSPAFAEYGFGPSDDFRIEPEVESIHGRFSLVSC